MANVHASLGLFKSLPNSKGSLIDVISTPDDMDTTFKLGIVGSPTDSGNPVGGGATNATVSGLPNGVNFSYDATAKVLSIEGTPTDDIASETTYNYAVTTSGSGCDEQILRGTITVQPMAELTLLPSSGALDQVLCEGEAIAPVLIELNGGTDIASISGLPDGVNYTFDAATRVVTISGQPTETIDSFEVFSFVISSISASCTETTLQGSIRIDGDSPGSLLPIFLIWPVKPNFGIWNFAPFKNNCKSRHMCWRLAAAHFANSKQPPCCATMRL